MRQLTHEECDCILSDMAKMLDRSHHDRRDILELTAIRIEHTTQNAATLAAGGNITAEAQPDG